MSTPPKQVVMVDWGQSLLVGTPKTSTTCQQQVQHVLFPLLDALVEFRLAKSQAEQSKEMLLTAFEGATQGHDIANEEGYDHDLVAVVSFPILMPFNAPLKVLKHIYDRGRQMTHWFVD